MKMLAATAAALLLATGVSAECVVVAGATPEIPTFQAATQRIRMTALQNGKALENVRVLFYLGSAELNPKLVLITDKKGEILTTGLAPGPYRVRAIGPEPEFTEVYVQVADKLGTETTSFLLAIPSTFPTVKVSEISGAAVTEHIREFKGHVGDPSGAFVPGAFVQVFRNGAPNDAVVKIKADRDGLFSASLAPGQYVVFVSSPGFSNKVMGFEVSPNGEAKDLLLSLRIGFC